MKLKLTKNIALNHEEEVVLNQSSIKNMQIRSNFGEQNITIQGLDGIFNQNEKRISFKNGVNATFEHCIINANSLDINLIDKVLILEGSVITKIPIE